MSNPHNAASAAIRLDLTGQMEHATPQAVALLDEYFSWKKRDVLPGPVAQWIDDSTRKLAQSSSSDNPPVAEATADYGQRRLILRLTRHETGHFVELREAPALVTARESVWNRLTPRKREILNWVAEGKTNHEISIILGISIKTVEKHLSEACHALGVNNRIGLLREYFRFGVAHPSPDPAAG